ncbi:MAG: dipicolinate synthase subunit DpsA [Defluviitaleaceae bacterium]|nr:dipicolinate synthase subunit DpsA [Defluviitaleaceae bacterium]
MILENPQKFAIVGGDKRNIALAEKLFRLGHEVRLFGFAESGLELPMQCKNLRETVLGARYIIGPTPCSLGGGALNAPFHNASLHMEDLFRLMKTGQTLIAGFVKPEVKCLAVGHGIEIVDMLEREEMLVLNAIPTAEGAIKIAIEETDITLHGNRVIVIGYGRIGTVLSRMLSGMGAKVSVVVNTSHAAALAESAGHDVICFRNMDNALPSATVIFNTVPEIILDEKNLPLVRKSTLLIDLASAPNGVDACAARTLGLKTLFANSLPGLVAPVTTAEYILATVERIITNTECISVTETEVET